MGFMAAPDWLQMKRSSLEFDAEMHHPAQYSTHRLVHYHQQLPAKNQGRGFSLADASLQLGETLSRLTRAQAAAEQTLHPIHTEILTPPAAPSLTQRAELKPAAAPRA